MGVGVGVQEAKERRFFSFSSESWRSLNNVDRYLGIFSFHRPICRWLVGLAGSQGPVVGLAKELESLA